MLTSVFQPDVLTARMTTLRAMIRPYVLLDTQKLCTMEQFDAAMTTDLANVGPATSTGTGGFPGSGPGGGPGGNPGGGLGEVPALDPFIRQHYGRMRGCPMLAQVGRPLQCDCLSPQVLKLLWGGLKLG